MRKHIYIGFVLLTAISLVLSLGLGGCASTANAEPPVTAAVQTTTLQTVAPPTTAVQTTQEAPPAVTESTPTGGKAGQEGIKVHGSWTIEVTNPDGSLAERREFENALVFDGASTLASLLGRTNSMGGWTIRLSSSSPPFSDQSGAPSPGYLMENDNSLWYFPTSHFATLNVTVIPMVPSVSPAKLVLRGTGTAARVGQISNVSTSTTLRANTETPSPSYTLLNPVRYFTSATLPSVIDLVPGQQIIVTVTFTFS